MRRSTVVKVNAGVLVAAAVASTAASGAPRSGAAAGDQHRDVPDLGVISDVVDGTVSAETIASFLALTQEGRSKRLEAVGMTDAGGDLNDPLTQKYLVGQWLLKVGETGRGTQLILESGKPSAEERLDLLKKSPLGVGVNKDEVFDTMVAGGVTMEEATVRASLQRQARLVRPMLRELDKGYVYLAVVPGPRLVYRTTEPDQARQLLDYLGDTVTIEVGTVSERAMVAQFEDVSATLTKYVADGTVRNLWLDKMREVIHAEVAPGSQETIRNVLRSETGSIGLEVSETEQILREGTIFRGGISSSTCTWGFTTNVDDLLTAGHCDNPQNYAGNAQPYVAGSEINSGNFDYQRHDMNGGTSGIDARNQVWVGGSTYRSITAVEPYSAMDIMDTMCHVGKTTGYSCGHISTVTGSQAVGGGTQVIRSVGSGLKALPGDSGGPIIYREQRAGPLRGPERVQPTGCSDDLDGRAIR